MPAFGPTSGHYLLMRKTNSASNAKAAGFGVMFFTLVVYYGALLIIIYAFTDTFLGTSFEDQSVFINAPKIFGPYLVIYFLFISPKLKGEIDDNMSEEVQRRKKRIATIYFIVGIIALPLAALLSDLITGR